VRRATVRQAKNDAFEGKRAEHSKKKRVLRFKDMLC
jgi:hypothetical protein